MFKLKNQITGNSRTNIRAIASQEFDDETGQLVQDVAQHGWKSVAVDKAIGAVQKFRAGMSDKTAADVAKILYETDPKEKYKIVQRLRQTAQLNKNTVQGTKAAEKLETYYGISDAIKNARVLQGVAGSTAIPSINIRNTGGN